MAFDITQLPQDVLDKLKNALRFGKGGAPASGPQGNVPVNPDLNPDYQREPGGLLKRGAATPGTQPSPTDATQQQGTPAPTLTPSTPQGQKPAPTTGGTAPKPQLTDAQWAQQNPGAAPAPPTPFTPPSLRSRLGHTLMYGALEGVKPAIEYNQNIGTQEKASQTAQQNYPQTLHAAREKEEMTQADLANKQATTANLQSETANRGVPKNADEQLTKAIADKDQRTIDTVIATKAQIWKTEHPDDQTPKDAFQLFMKSWATQHPDNPTPKYEDFQAAQQAEAEAKAKAERDAKPIADEGTWTMSGEDAQGNPIEINSKTGAQRPAPAGVFPKGTHKAAQAEIDKKIKPFQDLIDNISEAKDFAAAPSPTNDYALLMAFIGTTKPEGLGKLRLNTQELKIATGTRSALGDVDALAHKIGNGEMLTKGQRQDMVDTMEVIAKRAQANIDQAKGAPGAAAPGEGGTVNMRAPDGTVKPVPKDQVDHYKSKGAVVVQ
jgi:hypothetical protein